MLYALSIEVVENQHIIIIVIALTFIICVKTLSLVIFVYN